MVKKFKSWLNIIFLTVVLIIPGLVFGASTQALKEEATPLNRLKDVATTYGPYTTEANDTTLASTLGVIIGVVLSILGVVFMFIVIMAGYQWMTAQGNEAQVTKAKDSMTRAIIGLIVVISSYAIWVFIKNVFIKQI